MKIVLSFACMLFLAAPALAQLEAAPAGTVAPVQPTAKQAGKRKAVPALKENKKTAPAQTEKKEPAKGDQSEEEGSVIIDARSDEDYAERFSDSEPAAAAEPVEIAVPGGIPASYGQLKGAINDSGRSLLTFESDDGTISFVQIFVGKSAVSWKLISRIYRSAD